MYDTKDQSSGPVAQLGARMTGSHEVEGSNPSRSTNYPQQVSQLQIVNNLPLGRR